MTLDDLGNLGEFVGALAVIVSVAYLAIQIRQNTRSLRASAFHNPSNSVANSDFVAFVEQDRARFQQRDDRSAQCAHVRERSMRARAWRAR